MLYTWGGDLSWMEPADVRAAQAAAQAQAQALALSSPGATPTAASFDRIAAGSPRVHGGRGGGSMLSRVGSLVSLGSAKGSPVAHGKGFGSAGGSGDAAAAAAAAAAGGGSAHFSPGKLQPPVVASTAAAAAAGALVLKSGKRDNHK